MRLKIIQEVVIRTKVLTKTLSNFMKIIKKSYKEWHEKRKKTKKERMEKVDVEGCLKKINKN